MEELPCDLEQRVPQKATERVPCASRAPGAGAARGAFGSCPAGLRPLPALNVYFICAPWSREAGAAVRTQRTDVLTETSDLGDRPGLTHLPSPPGPAGGHSIPGPITHTASICGARGWGTEGSRSRSEVEAATREGKHPVSGKVVAAPSTAPPLSVVGQWFRPGLHGSSGLSWGLVSQEWGVQEEGTVCWVVGERSENRGRMLRAPLGGQWVQR